MSRSLQLNINLNLSKSDILINEGTTSQISLKNSSRQDCNYEHIIVKWNSSSTPELHNLLMIDHCLVSISIKSTYLLTYRRLISIYMYLSSNNKTLNAR